MSGNLSAFELLHRENLFIRLKNHGKNLDEIALLLDVEKELVEKWNEELEKEMKTWQSNSPNIFMLQIVKKTIEKEYTKAQSFNIKLSNLDRIIFDLFKISTIDTGKLLGEQKKIVDKLKDESTIHIKTLQENLIEIGKIEVNETTNEVMAQFRYKKEISDEHKIKEALIFWASVCYKIEQEKQKDILIEVINNDCVAQNSNYYKTLPYALKQFKIENHHSIKNIHLENLNIDAQWIFLFGENGFGKTSILQAIALGLLANSKETENINIEKTTKIGIEFINDYANQINNLYNENKNPVENIVCYGSSRLNMGIEDTKEDEMQKSGLTYSLFHTDGRLLNIEKYFKQWFLDKDERFEKVIEAFKTIIPYLHDIQVVKNEQREFEVHYFEKELTENGESGASFQKVSFNHLAAGLKSVLAMVGDMFIRLYRTQPLVINPSELVGIAIIDELELHLHPKWQIKLPQLLSTVFPKVQFIVSTHSAIPLLGATPNAVFIKVTRDKENGIQAQKMDIDLKNLTPNQLFYFLFDMESITSVNNTNLAEVRTEDTKAEFLENDEVKRRLKAFETKKADTDFPDDLFEPENSVVK